jgi:ADP-ribose pyrophosphatase YjhB (NUDIX family)
VSLKDTAIDGAARAWRALSPGMRRSFLQATHDLFLVGVLGLVFDREGRVLLLEHRYRTPWPWGPPGGYVDHGESLEEALGRELREELALEVEIEGPPFDVELLVQNRAMTVTFIAHPRIADAPLTFSAEILSGRFFASDEMPESIYPYHRALIQRGFAMKGRLRGSTKAT